MWSESHEHANYTNWAHREHSGTGEDYGDCDAFSNVWEDAQQVNLEHSKVGMITTVMVNHGKPQFMVCARLKIFD